MGLCGHRHGDGKRHVYHCGVCYFDGSWTAVFISPGRTPGQQCFCGKVDPACPSGCGCTRYFVGLSKVRVQNFSVVKLPDGILQIKVLLVLPEVCDLYGHNLRRSERGGEDCGRRDHSGGIAM